MHIEFHGAAGEVTGSCHLVEAGGRRILLDCGLVQGDPHDLARNAEAFAFDPASIDAVVLSHAHIDHSGRIPFLVRCGFRGPIYTQKASRDLCRIMLRDSAYLNEKETEWENRKRERKGLELLEPLYTRQDVTAAMRQFRAIDYDDRQEILPGIGLRLVDAGHILGSAIVELWLGEGGVERKLVYSGDLGVPGRPILRDPALVEQADFVVLESTYGDRLHRSLAETQNEVAAIVRETRSARGNIIIPAFAVGRTQHLLYEFAKNYSAWNLDRWHIFLDSPMAIEATEVYARHAELYDRESAALWLENSHRPLLPNLHLTRTASQSMRLNRIRSGAIIIAGSGMCTGGRVKHHLKHNIWREDCHVIIVGFQARGTPGRMLVDGARRIRLWGETYRVKARVHTVGGLSAHADQAGLVDWYGNLRGRPPVALVHGEAEAIDALATCLDTAGAARVIKPLPGERVELA